MLVPYIVGACDPKEERGKTYILPVWRLAVLLIVLTDLVEIIFVELAHEASKIAVLEVLRQDGLRKFLALEGMNELASTRRCDRTQPS